MSRQRDFNFRAPPPSAPTLRITTPPSLPTRSFSGMDSKVMTGELKMVTLTQAQISSGVRESAMRSGTSSSLISVDWAGTRSSLIPSSTGSTVSSLTPRLSTLHLPSSAVTSSSGSSLSLTAPKSTTTTTTTTTTSQTTTVSGSESKINTAGRFFEPSYKFAKKSNIFGSIKDIEEFPKSVKKDLQAYIYDTKMVSLSFCGRKVSKKNEQGEIIVIKALNDIYNGLPETTLKPKFLFHIKNVKMINMSIDSNTIPYLAFMQKLHLNLEFLSFTGNEIDDQGLHKLITYLFNTPPYSMLHSTGLSSTIEPKHDILSLDFRDNKITDKGVESVSGIIKGYKTLKSLDLSGNNITNKSFKEIIKSMESSVQSTAVTLYRKSVAFGIKHIKEGLKAFIEYAEKEKVVQTDHIVVNKELVDYLIDKSSGKGLLRDIGWGFIKCNSRIGYIEGFTAPDIAIDAVIVMSKNKYLKVGFAIYCGGQATYDAMMTPNGYDLAFKTLDLIGQLEKYEKSDIDVTGQGCELM